MEQTTEPTSMDLVNDFAWKHQLTKGQFDELKELIAVIKADAISKARKALK